MEGITIQALPTDKPLAVMGTPVGPKVTPTDMLESFMERARRCFRAKYDILHSNASLKHRLLVLDRVVLATMTWVFGILHPTKEITTTLNQLQVEMVMSMGKWKRGSKEGYVDYKQRGSRYARACIFQSGRERWGSVQIRLSWRFLGHRLRASQTSSPSCSGILTAFRPLEWWEGQQATNSGKRHLRRHYPRLMSQQREIRHIAGEQWQQLALQRVEWAKLENTWLAYKDVQWASGRQLQITE